MHGRPKGLNRLLFAEFWERASYFAMLSGFALYLNERLQIPEGRASALAGTFAALSYLTPLAGGWLADCVLGSRRTLLLGTSLLATGYAVFVHPSVLALYVAIVLVTFGSGLYKPNITTAIGALFARVDDSRRPATLRAFYLCINLAATVAPFAMSAIQSRFGWPVAFGTCALAMLVCLCALLSTRSESAGPLPSASRSAGNPGSALGAGALALLCVPAMAFFAVYSQSLGTLIFWSRDRVDLTLGGLLSSPANPAATCALIPLLAVALSPVMEPLRLFLRRWGFLRSVSGELRLALLLAALSVLILAIPEAYSRGNIRVGAGWLLASYGLATLSELLIVPLCLCLVEAIAPPQRSATYTAVWYLSAAVGSQLAGDVGRLWGTISAVSYFLLIAMVPLTAYGLLWTLGHHIDRRQMQRDGERPVL